MTAAPANNLVFIDGLSHIYAADTGAVHALSEVSLHIHRREFVTILGPSGCGKSTLLNILAGFERAATGTVLMEGAPILGPSPTRGVVFQDAGALFPWMTVKGNISFGLRASGRRSKEIDQSIRAVLELVRLGDFADKFPSQLSGGMRQLVAIARVLVMDARLLLMDEPFAALDAITRQRMQEQLTEIWERSNATILFITHSVDEAIFLSDRVLVMSGRPGRIKAEIEVPLPRPRDVVSDAFNRLRARAIELLR
jgi:NitT/TauT family transport system ATP-binding protein